LAALLGLGGVHYVPFAIGPHNTYIGFSIGIPSDEAQL